MAKWSGVIAFEIEYEDEYGVVSEIPIERPYVGDFNRNYRRLQSGISVNDKVSINNELSVIADPFILNNFHTIRYVTYLGTKWKVDTVEVQYPRLVMSLGGVYNNG